MSKYILSLCWVTLFLCPFCPLQAQQQDAFSVPQIPLSQVLNSIGKQYKVNFLYEETNLSAKTFPFDIHDYKGDNLTELLNKILTPLNLTFFKVDNENFSVFPIHKAQRTAGTSVYKLSETAKDTIANHEVLGKVLNELKQAQQFATVSILRAADSSIVSNALSDTSGYFKFSQLKSGAYLMRITNMGYQTAYSPKFELSAASITLEPIAMNLLPHTLKTVQITASRPIVETKSDRFVLNVENSAMASGNSIQLLKSAPFVQVSQDNTVTLQGKKTMILIDNKPVPDAALETILKTLPSGNISKIELITHPSAKYDATYGAVINITTKKASIEGITGNVKVDGSQGIYGEGSLNTSITYKHKGLTLFGTAGLTRGDNMFKVTSDRVFSTSSLPEVLTNNWERLSHNNLLALHFGGEFSIDNDQTIGVLVNPNIYRFSGPWTTVNTFSKQGSAVDSILNTNASFHQKAAIGNYNINYHLSVDSGKNDLVALVTYTPFSRNLKQYFPSVLTDASGSIIRVPADYQTVNTADINVWIGQTDYTHLFKNQIKLESGIKYQTTQSKATVDYNDVVNNQLINVPLYSSNNNLNEHILGAYGAVIKNWKADLLQFGLRAENTKAVLLGTADQQYFNIFPTFLFQHNLNASDNVSVTFKRTINRAPYFELVPYTVFVNQYTIEQGNPSLKPEFDNIYSLNVNLHQVNLSLSYTDAKGLIGLFPVRQDYSTGVTYFSRRNLDHSSDISLYLYFPLHLTSWWDTENSGTIVGYNTATGQVFASNYNLSAFHSDFKIAQIFKLSKIIKLEIDAYYWTQYVQDLSRQSGYKNLDASLLINLWDGRGQFRIGGNQIVFKRNDYHIVRDYGTYSSREIVSTDSRRITVGFTYNFGKTKITTPNKKLGNEDATKRL